MIRKFKLGRSCRWSRRANVPQVACDHTRVANLGVRQFAGQSVKIAS